MDHTSTMIMVLLLAFLSGLLLERGERSEVDGLDRADSRAAARIRGVVRPVFPDGDRMRKTVATVTKGLYLLLTEMIAVYLIAFPVHAFQVSSSSTGYVRVATASAISAYQVAQRAAFTGAVASAISAPTVASVAVRIATGPVGWGLLGVSAALTLASLYYSAQDVQAVKTAALAAAPPVGTRSDGSGTTLPAGAVWNPASCVHPCAFNAQQFFYVDSVGESSTSCYLGNGGGTFTDPAWPGWTRSNASDLRPHLPETLVPQERWDSDLQSTGDRICPSLKFDPGRVPDLCRRSACRESQFHRIQDGPSGTGGHGSIGGERDHAARVTDRGGAHGEAGLASGPHGCGD